MIKGNILKEYRKKYSLTQKELAKKLGYSLATIKFYETKQEKVSERMMLALENLSKTLVKEWTIINYKSEIANIKEKMEVAPPKIIEEAEVPSSPVSPSMNKNVMMGALAGFALAAAIVILFAIMNDSIKTEDDIERALGIPTLAVIPDRKDYIDDHGGSKKKKGKRRRQSKWRNKR